LDISCAANKSFLLDLKELFLLGLCSFHQWNLVFYQAVTIIITGIKKGFLTVTFLFIYSCLAQNNLSPKISIPPQRDAKTPKGEWGEKQQLLTSSRIGF
jgi:hypothetical protein